MGLEGPNLCTPSRSLAAGAGASAAPHRINLRLPASAHTANILNTIASALPETKEKRVIHEGTTLDDEGPALGEGEG